MRVRGSSDCSVHEVSDGSFHASQRSFGIFSERDYARKVALRGKSSKDTHVREIMTEKVDCVSPSQSVNECMGLMTRKHIRHLPVMDNNQLAGVISIGDVVKAVISEHEFTIEQLESYITGIPTTRGVSA